MAVALAACGSSGSGSSGGAPDKVTIAALLPLTGPNAPYGKYQVNGAKMAIDEINAKGGIDGTTKIELAIEDSQADPEKTVTAFNRAYSQHEMPVAISVGSSSILALLPLADQRDVTVLNGGSQGDELAGASELLFNTIPLIRNEASVLAPYVAEKKRLKRAAIIYIDDDLGRAAQEDFRSDFEAAGGEIVAEASHEPEATDVRSQLTKLRNANPEALFIASYGEPAKTIVDQARQLGWDVQLVGPSLVALPEVIEDPNADGAVLAEIPFRPAPSFVARYEQRYGEKPEHPFVGTYYDAARIAAEAYGYAAKHGYGTDGEGIAKAIHEIGTFESAFGGQVSFDKEGVIERPISIVVVKGGKSVTQEQQR